MAASKNKAFIHRKIVRRKRFTKKKNVSVKTDQIYHNGFNAGFTNGFEDGHQLAYEQQP